MSIITKALNSLPDGRYFDGTYEWDKEDGEWFPLRAPSGMPTHPELGCLSKVETIRIPVQFDEDGLYVEQAGLSYTE